MSSTNLVKKNLFTKPYLLTLDEISQIGQNMNLVGYDPQLNITSDDTNIVLKYGVPSSPKILNWVEPYKVAGIDYTLFYTEVNSGLNIGDRVFIINGTYDSDLLIKEETIPVFFEGQVIAVISRHRNAEQMRSPGKLELNYREIANHLYQMVAEGNFPYKDAGSLFEPVPRVGDGLIRLDVNGAISFASPNAKASGGLAVMAAR